MSPILNGTMGMAFFASVLTLGVYIATVRYLLVMMAAEHQKADSARRKLNEQTDILNPLVYLVIAILMMTLFRIVAHAMGMEDRGLVVLDLALFSGVGWVLLRLGYLHRLADRGFRGLGPDG